MSIWFEPLTAEQLNRRTVSHMPAHIGFEFTEVGEDYLCARLPVDDRTKQPYGLLHGGASCVVSETMGSTATALCIDPERYYCVGVEINANHLRSATSGYVHAKTSPIRTGRRIQVWETRLHNDANKLTCVSRLTTMVIPK